MCGKQHMSAIKGTSRTKDTKRAISLQMRADETGIDPAVTSDPTCLKQDRLLTESYGVHKPQFLAQWR
eukprot:54624-Eustigmatos_ZCMA.PRE.1